MGLLMFDLHCPSMVRPAFIIRHCLYQQYAAPAVVTVSHGIAGATAKGAAGTLIRSLVLLHEVAHG